MNSVVVKDTRAAERGVYVGERGGGRDGGEGVCVRERERDSGAGVCVREREGRRGRCV